MTRDEAVRLAIVLSTADRGCEVCVRMLCEEATQSFPEWRFEMDDEEINERGFPLVSIFATAPDK